MPQTEEVFENVGPRGCATIIVLILLAYIALLVGFACEFNLDELIGYLIK